MRAIDLVVLYDYYYWATKKILEQATKLTAAQWVASSALGDRSVQTILVHTLGAERGWRSGWEGKERPARLQDADFPDAAALAASWEVEERAMRAYLGSVSDDALAGPFYDVTLWHVIAHVAHHGMQHRSEAALLLTGYGYSPGDIDMVFWLEERAK